MRCFVDDAYKTFESRALTALYGSKGGGIKGDNILFNSNNLDVIRDGPFNAPHNR